MPQDGLFFRVLRRFNTILATLIGLAILIGGGFGAYNYYQMQKVMHARMSALGVNAPSASPGELSLLPATLGSAEAAYSPWDGTTFTLSRTAPLPDAATPDAYVGFTPNEVVNMMVIDPKTGEGSWLFAGNEQIIDMRDAVYEGAAQGATTTTTDVRPVLGMVLFVRPADKEGKATASAGTTVYMWSKASGAMVKLLTADKIETYDQAGADRYVIVYDKGGRMHAATWSIPGFKPLSDKTMPATPK